MGKTAIAALAIALLSVSFLMGCAQNAPAASGGAAIVANEAGGNAAESGSSDVVSGNEIPKDVVNLKGAKKGDTVSVDYLGKLEDGKVFDTSIEAEAKKAGIPLRPEYEPLQFKVGAGQMIAGFDETVVGMEVGDEKTVTLAPEKAYGVANKDLMLTIPRSNIPAGADVKVGGVLSASNGIRGRITALNAENVTIDFNHELAGKKLVFYIKMVKIN